MIGSILPASVAAVSTTRELPDELFASERAAIELAVEERRREFRTGRACARRALARIGVPRTAIAVGSRGEPLWPDGVVGSLTHCDGYCACAVARRRDVAAIGIDAEPHAPLSPRVLAGISTSGERDMLAARPAGLHLDRLLFSAKEAVFKAWSAYADRPLGYADCAVAFDTSSATFRALLEAPWPVVDGVARSELRGRWRVHDGIVVTAVVLAAA